MFKDFQELNDAISGFNKTSYASNMERNLSALSEIEAAAHSITDPYSEAYASVQWMKYDQETGDPSDVTPDEQQTVPSNVLSRMKAKIRSLVNSLIPVSTQTVEVSTQMFLKFVPASGLRAYFVRQSGDLFLRIEAATSDSGYAVAIRGTFDAQSSPNTFVAFNKTGSAPYPTIYFEDNANKDRVMYVSYGAVQYEQKMGIMIAFKESGGNYVVLISTDNRLYYCRPTTLEPGDYALSYKDVGYSGSREAYSPMGIPMRYWQIISQYVADGDYPIQAYSHEYWFKQGTGVVTSGIVAKAYPVSIDLSTATLYDGLDNLISAVEML